MEIPTPLPARQSFLEEVIGQCLVSMDQRKDYYRTLKNYYLEGHDGTNDPSSVINKIFPHIDQVSSFMYSQDTTRFSIEVDKSVPDLEMSRVPPLSEVVNDVWHASNTDILYGNALDWSYVYGSMFIKARWNVDRIEPFIVEPHNMGVYREDVIGLSRQQAFIHCYLIPDTQLIHDLTVANMARADIDRILGEATIQSGFVDNEDTGPTDQILVSAINPEIVGEVQLNLTPLINYVPQTRQKMARMYELYVYDSAIGDYRVFTLAHPFVPVYDRPMKEIFVDNEIPFVQICPYPLHDYFWGIAPVERLIPLQIMRNRRWQQIQHLIDLEASPPKWASGFTGDSDEMADTLDSPAGLVSSSESGQGKIDSVAPKMPDDLFGVLSYIDGLFDDVMGVNNIMSGRGEEGVRSEGHASQLLRVGASRTKRRAMVIEDSLEELASMYLSILQRYSDKTYRADDGHEFLPAQFTRDHVVKVDAHSNSPVFVQDQAQLAFQLFKAKAIDREELIEMLNVPMKDLLKKKLKTKIEPAEAEQAAADRALAKETGKVASIKRK